MRWLSMALLLSLAPLARAQSVQATKLAEKVQRFYERTRDLSADVSQTYKYSAQSYTMHATGTMLLKKPGMLRWTVAKPYPKQYVLDGKALYIYDADENEVLVQRHFSADKLSGAITFLWGKGRLTREFQVALANRPDLGKTVLELTPKKSESGFRKLFFAVDPKTGMVEKSVVIDPEGNENEMTFTHVKINSGVPASRFRFQIPKGATVTEQP